MKLSEISWRDYIAIEVLPAIVSRGDTQPAEQVIQAFDIADAMLHKMGRYTYESDKSATALARAEITIEVLRAENLRLSNRVSELKEDLGL